MFFFFFFFQHQQTCFVITIHFESVEGKNTAEITNCLCHVYCFFTFFISFSYLFISFGLQLEWGWVERDSWVIVNKPMFSPYLFNRTVDVIFILSTQGSR